MDQQDPRLAGKITSANLRNIIDCTKYIEKHPMELASDFRKFYGISLWDIPSKVSWAEAVLLISALMKNTQSAIHGAVMEIPQPYTYTDQLLADSNDFFLQANSGKKKPKRYPRIWERPKKISKGSLPLSKAAGFFAKLGHKPTIN